MPPDPRQRNQRQWATDKEPRVVDFAGPKQKEAFEYGPAPLVLSGAFNSAKTVTFCLKMLYVADLYPGYRWLIARKVWDELKKTTLSSFFKFCPRQAYEPHGRRSDQEKILELNNGSSFIYAHLDDTDVLTLLRGLEINGAFVDQMEECEAEHVTTIMTRLGRWDQVTVPDLLIERHRMETGQDWPYVHEGTGRPMPPAYFLGTCNPDHELHWIYEMFHPESIGHYEKRIAVERQPRRLADGSYAPVGARVSYFDLGYRMIEVSSYDNKYATRQALEQAEAMDETWKRRFLYGKWGIPEGQIHHVREESILEPSQAVLSHIQSRCLFSRAMDHGDSAPTAVGWFAVDGDGNVFCFREYYQPNKLISEHRQSVAALSAGEHYTYELADPAIFAPSMQKHGRRWSVAEEWADCVNFPRETAVFWQRGDNDELGTRNRISEYLRPQGVWQLQGDTPSEVPRIHPITKEKGLWPRLFFVKKTQDYPNGCDQVIRQVRSQRREKLGTENGRPIFSDDRDMKIADHAYDFLRYFMAVQAPAPNSIPRKYSVKSFMGQRKLAHEFQRKRKLIAKLGQSYYQNRP